MVSVKFTQCECQALKGECLGILKSRINLFKIIYNVHKWYVMFGTISIIFFPLGLFHVGYVTHIFYKYFGSEIVYYIHV